MECDSERVGCGGEPGAGKGRIRRSYGKRRAFVMFVFLFLARGSAKAKGGIRGKEWPCGVTDRRMGERFCYLHKYFYLSVS